MELQIKILVNGELWEFWEQIDPTDDNLRNLSAGVAASVLRAKQEFDDGKPAETCVSQTGCSCVGK